MWIVRVYDQNLHTKYVTAGFRTSRRARAYAAGLAQTDGFPATNIYQQHETGDVYQVTKEATR